MGGKKLLLFWFLLVLTSLVIADIVIDTSSGSDFAPSQGISYLFNISVENTGISENSNITEVNITIDSDFVFSAGSNDSSVTSTFTNTSTVLRWRKTGGMIGANTTGYFWFNATSDTSGSYSFSVKATNSSGSETTALNFDVTSTAPVASQANLVNNYNSSTTNL
ncbi:MAG: hypothetical protein KKB31_06150, partial [Nanoarchaeota archaeon]|nr:hypothetical protein [Nanoarchaeota archaeon]